MYTITGSGEAHLGVWVKSLERYQHSVEDFFELYWSKPPHPEQNEGDRGLRYPISSVTSLTVIQSSWRAFQVASAREETSIFE